jgi:hypothetical protein
MTSPDPVEVLDPFFAEIVTIDGSTLSATVVALQAVELMDADCWVQLVTTPPTSTMSGATNASRVERRLGCIDGDDLPANPMRLATSWKSWPSA